MASGSSSQDHQFPSHGAITMPSPLPEPMTPLTQFIDQQQAPPQTPQSNHPLSNAPASSLMPPPSAPPSHHPHSSGPSSSGSSYPSLGSPASPQTPMSTPESLGIIPQLHWLKTEENANVSYQPVTSNATGNKFKGENPRENCFRDWNIVSTVDLGCKLNLKEIALHARNAEYNPKRFAAVIMRIRDPRTTALVFSSGKMVCTGAKSVALSRLAARKYARIIQKLGFPARFTSFKVQNMVGSCDVKFPIRLEGLVVKHGQFSSYEPELFPGLIYRMVRPRIVLLIFVSGKVVLTGAKEESEIMEAFNNIYPILKKFKKS